MSSITRSGRQSAIVLGLGLLMPSCGLVDSAVEAPERMVRAVVPGGEQPVQSTEDLLPDLLRYADLIVLRAEEATQRFAADVGTPEAQLQASLWRLESIRWTTQIATGPNSLTSVLDLVVFATMLSYIQEDHWIPVVWGEPARPMLIAHLAAARDGWLLLERYLPVEEVEQARVIIADWRQANPLLTQSSLVEFPGFGSLAANRTPAGQPGPGLMNRLGLDPMADLEPAVRELELARQFGMRALYFMQRAPRLVASEVEYRTLALRGSDEVRLLLEEIERGTVALESFAATAATMPDALRQEREAALQQAAEILDAQRVSLFDALKQEREATLLQTAAILDAQRAGLLADLEQANAPLGSLLQETQAALIAGTNMSIELTAALQALDSFVGRFDNPDETAASTAATGAAASAAASSPSDPPSQPFDVSEYGVAAEQVGRAAAELSSLLSALDQRLPEVQKMVDEAATRGERAVDHVMLRALQVGLALIAATALAVFLVRRRRA